MNILIDWISFTMEATNSDQYSSSEVALKARDTVYMNGLGGVLQFDHHTWQRRGGRPPYSVSWEHKGVTVYAGKPYTILVEVAGQGCAHLAARGIQLWEYEAVLRGVTRIDLAADMLCETSPDTFVECAAKKHIRSSGRFVSDSGHTCYVGSKKSDRYARVYRYSPPHPRSEYLRCEMVMRHEQARKCIIFVSTDGLEAALRVYGDMFGWKHPEWQITAFTGHSRPTGATIRRSSNKTVTWLIRQAAPAFRKCLEDGSIADAHSFLEEHFLLSVKDE